MLQPIESPPPSTAPRLAASMMPGPPPVMMGIPLEARIRAVSTAAWYCRLVGGVRAEPKIVTPPITSPRLSNPSTNSAMIRNTRHGSVLSRASGRIWGGGPPKRSSSSVGLGYSPPGAQVRSFDGESATGQSLEQGAMIVGNIVEVRRDAE